VLNEGPDIKVYPVLVSSFNTGGVCEEGVCEEFLSFPASELTEQ